MMIRLARIAFLVLAALSVTVFPMVPSHTAHAKANDLVASAGPSDCGDHHGRQANGTPGVGCMAMAGCAVACSVSFATPVSTAAFSLAAGAAPSPVLVDPGIASKIGSPPFRPPRS